VDDGTVNAFAVPGGQVVLLRGLVERTRTPEELAGVLAHELQHVIQRHATRLLLQHASTGLVLVAVSGDITGAMAYGIESARMLGTLRYSRHLESEADVEGLRMLLAADDERAVSVDRADAPSVARDVVTEPADAGRAGVDLALDRGPFVGCGGAERPVARARLDHENQSRAVPLEALQGRPGGLYGPLNE